MIGALFRWYSAGARRKRGLLFLARLKPTTEEQIVDLGGGTGAHFESILPMRENVTVADLVDKDLEKAKKRGFKTLKFDGSSGKLPFDDGATDIIFCSSVIEHVTGPKEQVYNIDNTAEFESCAYKHQKAFANEIRRVSKKYFVQTPNRYFLIESHTWLPGLIAILPRRPQKAIIRFFNGFWPKKTAPDWYLLTAGQMAELFPDAQIIREKSMGLTKSLIAIKS